MVCSALCTEGIGWECKGVFVGFGGRLVVMHRCGDSVRAGGVDVGALLVVVFLFFITGLRDVSWWLQGARVTRTREEGAAPVDTVGG